MPFFTNIIVENGIALSALPRVNAVPFWITESLPTATAFQPYRLALSASDPDHQPRGLSYSITGPVPLPSGMTLSPDGVLSGTPTAAGYTTDIATALTFQVTDGGVPVSRTFPFTITVPPQAPPADAGVNWVDRTGDAPFPLYGIAYGNGLFAAVGSNSTIITSTNGVAWTRRLGAANQPTLQGIAYAAGQFVAVGGDSGGHAIIVTSPDGINWTERYATLDGLTINNVTYAAGMWVAVGSGTTILTSPNGVTWTKISLGSQLRFRGVGYGFGRFIVVGEAGLVYTSTDAATWTRITNKQNGELYAATYGAGQIIISGADGVSQGTTDGVNLAPRSISGAHITSINYNGKMWIAVGSYGLIAKSLDGYAWVGQNSGPGGNRFTAVTYGNGIYISVAESGAIRTSTG